MNDGRDADLEHLRKAHAQTRDPRERKNIEESARRIQQQRQNGAVRSMREALIREMRQGRLDNVKDIQQYIEKKQKYQG